VSLYSYNSPMNIVIEKIVYPGKALGRGTDGIATFVDGALPGETVEVTITKKKKSFQEGTLHNIIKPSDKRIHPRCPSFGKCGGCSFQHTDYEHQLKIKESYVKELIAPFCKNILPIISSPEIWGYRNKMEFSFFEREGTPAIGLHEKGSWNTYFDVPPCYLADPHILPLVTLLTTFAQHSGLPVYHPKSHQGFWRHVVFRTGKRTNEMLLNLVTASLPNISETFFIPLLSKLPPHITSIVWSINNHVSDVVQAEHMIVLKGKDHIEEQMQINNQWYRFIISPFSFFQTNTFGAEKLYETVYAFLQPVQQDILLDLYCGTGTIGISLAKYVHQCIGIEQVSDAIQNAEKNKTLNHIENITFYNSTVEQWIQHADIPAFTALILDPPRSGISSKVITLIARTHPPKIIYVSCNPATLARDLHILQQAGYRAQQAVAIDMFPQTFHVETVVQLQR